MIANRARGETVLTINGAPRRLCVTLGALAQLETAFEADSVAALAARLGQLSAGDLVIVLAALAEMSADQVANADIDIASAAKAVAEAFQRALA